MEKQPLIHSVVIRAVGHPPLVTLFFRLFGLFAIGILFGNLNAMAMRSLGQVAGLGASLIASGSSLVATLFAIGLGAAYDGSVMVLAAGIFLAGAAAIVLGELSFRVGDAPVVPIVISGENRHSR